MLMAAVLGSAWMGVAWLNALDSPLPVVTPLSSQVESTAKVLRTASFTHPRLTESSGVAASRSRPGVLWTHNDSGNEPWLFATDTGGRDLGVFEVSGAKNVDWEDIALGPCGRATCVYIADTGDNAERRSFVTLYRLPEPVPAGRPWRKAGRRRPTPAGPTEALRFRYPDGAYDVEALYIDERGDAFLITKGRSGPVLRYRLPAAAWARNEIAVAETVEPPPIVGERRLGGWVTGAALSPKGGTLAVRTYRDIHLIPRAADGRLTRPPDPPCALAGFEPQGEGIGWMDEQTLVLTSERGFGSDGLVSVVRCS